MTAHFTTAYRLLTERLLLRCWDPMDAPRLLDAFEASRGHLHPWIPWANRIPRSLDGTVEWLRGRRALFDRDELAWFGVFTADETELLGEAVLKRASRPEVREIGYWIDARRTGRGYARELTAALTRLSFELERAWRVEILCSPENPASAAIPRRLGFVHEATLPARFEDCEGTLRDDMIWALTRETYPRSACAGAELAAHDAIGRKIELVPPG